MIIKVENLSKSYGNIQAVKDISFTVSEGGLFSFLGTNGAGKSTTINILTTLISKTSGVAEVGGFDVEREADKVRRLNGVVFQDSVLDAMLTVRENLTTRGSLYGLHGNELKSAVDNAEKITDVKDIASRPYGKLSGGQRRRVDIARALVHMPKILFLDEPTTGLDPKTRRDIWLMIRDLQKASGMTVFLTTHYMEEAAESDDIVIIERGKIKARFEFRERKFCDYFFVIFVAHGFFFERGLKFFCENGDCFVLRHSTDRDFVYVDVRKNFFSRQASVKNYRKNKN